MKLETLRDLYGEQPQDLYRAETQLGEALPKMAQAASHTHLQSALHEHLPQPQHHVQWLEQLFQRLGSQPGGQPCNGMDGVIKAGAERIKTKGELVAIDAGVIAAAPCVVHDEIAGYGCARTDAQPLGDPEAASVLPQTLDTEATTDQQFTQRAEQVITVEAER